MNLYYLTILLMKTGLSPTLDQVEDYFLIDMIVY